MSINYSNLRRKLKIRLLKVCLLVQNREMKHLLKQLTDAEIEALYMKLAWETNRDIYGDSLRVKALWLQWQNQRLVAGQITKVRNLDEYPFTRTYGSSESLC